MSIRFRYLALPVCACGRRAGGHLPLTSARCCNISAQRLEADDRALAGFGTRSTLSSQADPKRGIGAATIWIFGQFKAAAATSNGRMTVELQTYHQPPVAGLITTRTALT